MSIVDNQSVEDTTLAVSEESAQVISAFSDPAEEPSIEPEPVFEAGGEVTAADDPTAIEQSLEETIPLTQFRRFGDALLETTHSVARDSQQSFDELRTEVLRFHERAAGYEDNARLMHTRIESLQQDQVRVLLKPMFERLAGLHAQANDIAEQKRESDASTAGDFSFFAESIEDLFSLYDLESVGATAGAPFDARQHAAARVIRVEQTDLDGTLQRVIRQGFGFAGTERVFMPARVTVCRYIAPA